ncbi:hypothetical protein SAMN04489722_101240 [Algibacter lectus]|uniref:hypothetical protein n=1 Tax=Algibacter lectus TaxID=221126 RepID=UPI0008EFCAB2|nr:hypothetical protein [Algibacter lectus]SFB91095.1 hypothetical protein SAMN04489722_101240 [Algibacter lectus]
MEQSEHSEEKIIKLGETLIEELKLEYTVNTLARWLSHYLSELIYKFKNSSSEKEKTKLGKECCEIILKLWSNKDVLPVNKPLQNLQPIVEILEVFKEKDFLISPRWLEYRHVNRKNEWANFIDLVKNNTEKIFNKSIEVNFNKDLIFKDREWLEKHEEFLTEEEKQIISHLDMMITIKEGVVDIDNLKKTSKKERYDYVFNELESLIDEQKNELTKLKNKIFKSLK